MTPNLFVVIGPGSSNEYPEPPLAVRDCWEEAVDCIHADAREGIVGAEYELEFDSELPITPLHPGMDSQEGTTVRAVSSDPHEKPLVYRICGFEVDWLPEGDNALGGR